MLINAQFGSFCNLFSVHFAVYVMQSQCASNVHSVFISYMLSSISLYARMLIVDVNIFIDISVLQMSYSRGSRYESRSPYRRSSYSRYRSRSRSVDSSDAENPGNNLYVTGLSARVTDQDLEKHFSTEGEVIDASIVHDPWTRESRGFGFVTMATVKEADRCIKYLDRSVLEGRVITVEKIFLAATG